DRGLEEPVADCFYLLPALTDERFPVPPVKRLSCLPFDRPLDVDSIPVESEWEEDGTAEHALGPRNHVYHRISHDRPDVPRAARIGRGRVNYIDGPPAGRSESVEIRLRLPHREDSFLERRLPGLLLQRRLSHRSAVESRGVHKRLVPCIRVVSWSSHGNAEEAPRDTST